MKGRLLTHKPLVALLLTVTLCTMPVVCLYVYRGMQPRNWGYSDVYMHVL